MTDPDTAALVERLRELLAKATPGPWTVWGPGADPSAAEPMPWQHVYEIRVDDGAPDSWPMRLATTPTHMTANRENYVLIAALRNAAPALLDERDRMAARIAALEEGLREARRHLMLDQTYSPLKGWIDACNTLDRLLEADHG